MIIMVSQRQLRIILNIMNYIHKININDSKFNLHNIIKILTYLFLILSLGFTSAVVLIKNQLRNSLNGLIFFPLLKLIFIFYSFKFEIIYDLI
jgi:hypothetical protein